MSGFGPFRPVVVQRAGWHFRPIRATMAAASPARQDIRGANALLQEPTVVQPAGWYFRPVRVSLAVRQNVLSRPTQRATSTRIYSSPNASSSPPTNSSGSFDGDAEA